MACLAAGLARPRHQSNASTLRGWSWIVINTPLNFVLNSSPLIKLMAAGWICVGELEQDVNPLNRRGLVMAPPMQVFELVQSDSNSDS